MTSEEPAAGKTPTQPAQGSDQSDLARWAELLSTAYVGGALPVSFRLDGDHVLVETIVPWVSPAPRPKENPNKIPLAIADGFPVPIVARHKLPPFSNVDAIRYLRDLARESYHHEIDEQFRVDQNRPFAGALHEATSDESP